MKHESMNVRRQTKKFIWSLKKLGQPIGEERRRKEEEEEGEKGEGRRKSVGPRYEM